MTFLAFQGLSVEVLGAQAGSEGLQHIQVCPYFPGPVFPPRASIPKSRWVRGGEKEEEIASRSLKEGEVRPSFLHRFHPGPGQFTPLSQETLAPTPLPPTMELPIHTVTRHSPLCHYLKLM